jgi:hypothetical protein
MPTNTLKFEVPDDEYLEVTDGHYNFFLRPLTPVGLRLHVGQTQPLAATEDYVPLVSTSFSLSDLEGTDKVYLMAEGAGLEVVVIRGG